MTDQINTHSATAPILITTMQMTFIAENVAIILNIVLLATFYYQIKKEKQRIYTANNGVSQNGSSTDQKKKKQSISRDSRFFRRSDSTNSRNKQKKNELNWQTVYITWTLLIIGFIFSLCQGLIENWLTNDCGAVWLQWTTFLFYAAHRSLLLFSFLHRLYFVFKDSAYSYPNWFYIILIILIISHFIAAYIIYGIDHGVTKVDIKMNTGFSGNILCSWSFGVLFSGISRPIEITLTLILVIAFLYKLWKLHILSTKYVYNDEENLGESKRINKLLIVFRKVTLLTLSAIATTAIVTFGYINFKPFAFALSLDAVFNSFCVFLMFQFNHKLISPCFGYKCDRLCCIKFKGICKCKIICCCNQCRLLSGICCKNIQNTEIPKKMGDLIIIKSIDISTNENKNNISMNNNTTKQSQIELNVMHNNNEEKINSKEGTNSNLHEIDQSKEYSGSVGSEIP